jgi:8-oxo-dGTP diphosphatase
MTPRLMGLLPVADPYLAPGEMIICHVAHGSSSRIVSVEQFKPFDD